MNRRFLTVAEAAVELGITADGMYRDIHSGRVGAIRAGHTIVVPARVLDALDAHMRGVEVPTPQGPVGPRFLGSAQAATLFRVAARTMSRLIRNDQFPGAVFTGRLLVASSVVTDLENQAVETMSLVDSRDYVAAANATVSGLAVAA